MIVVGLTNLLLLKYVQYYCSSCACLVICTIVVGRVYLLLLKYIDHQCADRRPSLSPLV